jgi:glyoxylase-like metal-dependent hydrolase (beta-lactamase superfamily II)
MRNAVFCAAFAASLALAVLAPGARAQPPAAPPAPAPLAIKPVKPGLYMVTGAGGNVTVRVTSEGLVVVDSKNNGQAVFDDLMGRIRSVSDQPVKWVIDTHHHADHTGNNARFLAAGATVIGHENLSVQLGKLTPPPNGTVPAKPSMTYANRYTIKLGGKTVELRHFAPAHTGGDTLVWFPDLKVVSTGDEFVIRPTGPNIDYAGGASIAGWIRSLDDVLKLDWDTAIAGHGDDIYARADVVGFQTRMKTLLSRAQAAVKAGATKETLMSQVKTDDLWSFAPTFWDAGRTAGLYAEAGGR